MNANDYRLEDVENALSVVTDLMNEDDDGDGTLEDLIENLGWVNSLAAEALFKIRLDGRIDDHEDDWQYPEG